MAATMFALQYAMLFVLLLFVNKCSGLANGRTERLLMDDNYYTLVSKLDNLTHDVQTLKADNLALTQQVQKLQAVTRVAFQASLSHEIPGSQDQVIIFDVVELNIGNAYSVLHGNMIAPVNGTYLFSISTCSGGSHAIVFDLMKNGASIGRVLAGDDQFIDCASKTFVIQLKSGDDIYVKEGTYGDYVQVYPNYGRPYFIGVLLDQN